MEVATVFDFEDYKAYLWAIISARSERSGFKTQFAEAAGIKLSFLSQVLKGNAHLSLEQAYRAGQFIGHDEDEADYFMNLVLQDRAGTRPLRSYYKQQLQNIRRRRFSVRKSVQIRNQISDKKKSIYYSSWIYPAVHMAVTIEKLQTQSALREYFQVESERINETIRFLIKAGLITESRGRLIPGQKQLNWQVRGNEIRQYHTSWRNKSIEALEKNNAEDDFRYSAVVTLSRADLDKIRGILTRSLGEIASAVKDSSEEELYAFQMDMFKLR